ncbi:MAG: ribosomal protein L11 methyltransferase [Gammaproteobacteria bacterium SG8_47]|nr:MAG: ribosomal protein L11 methyltransferase [Gammaproteobacteria bacterium SG8_47]
MPWTQLHLDTAPAQAPELADLLAEFGAVSVSLTDAADTPLFEPAPGTTPLWQHTRVTGLFGTDSNAEDIVARLRARLGREAVTDWRSEPLADQAWERTWMDRFEPLCFGRRLWICPSWHQPPQPNAVNILLDPGLAFGTGTHPTTAMCLQWLDAHEVSGLSVLDYGCGSGVLSVAAAKLGAHDVWAVDHDPQALEATRGNAVNNGVSDAINTLQPAQLPEGHFDVVIANILAQPLIDLAPQLLAALKHGGALVLSGILRQQVDSVCAAYSADCELNIYAERENWVCLSGASHDAHGNHDLAEG